jgi:4-hydroxybenzoate polyprenyltransferase
VWKPLEYSSGYLAILAALEVLIVGHLLSLPASPAPVVVGLITFAIYANDRLVDLSSDGVSNPERTAFVRQYQHVLHVCAATAYGLAVALSILGGPVAFALALIPGIAWVLYAVNWVPAIDIPFQRLKELLVINSAIVAVAWSLTIVFLPVAFAGAPITPTVWVLFWYLALGTFVCTEISNVRDIRSDIETGVATLPVAFGVRRTRHVLYGVSLLTAGILGQAVVNEYLTTTAAGALLAGLVSLIVLVSLVGRSNREKFLSVAGEFTRMPVLAILIVASL